MQTKKQQNNVNLKVFSALCFLAMGTLSLTLLEGCNRNGQSVLSASKVNKANFDQIHTGMSKNQVETILGSPTTAETKDMLIFKKTTYRYEDGSKFISISFKNDEVSDKESNFEAGS